MTITTAMPNSFKLECLTTLHDFTTGAGDAFKVALIKATPTGNYDKTTVNYSDVTGNTDEAVGAGYTVGGAVLANQAVSLDGDAAIVDWDNVIWTAATISADGCIIYNTSATNRAAGIYDFGGTKTASGGNFELVMPAPAAATAVLRFA